MQSTHPFSPRILNTSRELQRGIALHDKPTAQKRHYMMPNSGPSISVLRICHALVYLGCTTPQAARPVGHELATHCLAA
jgi:hypothetical protein